MSAKLSSNPCSSAKPGLSIKCGVKAGPPIIIKRDS